MTRKQSELTLLDNQLRDIEKAVDQLEVLEHSATFALHDLRAQLKWFRSEMFRQLGQGLVPPPAGPPVPPPDAGLPEVG